MSDTTLQEVETHEAIDASLQTAEYIDAASKYDGSRTPPQKIALVHALKREGRSINAICQILSMSPLTVKAVLARGESLISDARMLLQANALAFAGDAIHASKVAAEKGKIEGISAMLDRLGVTEPPKSGQQTSVGVQVILHGGAAPAELGNRPESVKSEGESGVIEAKDVEVGLITPTSDNGRSEHLCVNQGVSAASVAIQDTTHIQANKCSVATGGDSL